MAVDSDRLMPLGAIAALIADIDDYCGTRPPRPHTAWLRELLVAVAVVRLVGTLDESPIRARMIRLAAELATEGLERAGSDPMPGLVAGL